MAKIQRIEIVNLKAIASFEADFNGCTAIITAGNNKGKTTLLDSIPARIRNEKPELIVKEGQKAGKSIMTLTTGERFEWEYDNAGKDKLTFITKEGYRTAVTKEIANKFFPVLFDLDKFINEDPKGKAKMLKALSKVDITSLDLAYKSAYEERTLINRQVKEQEARMYSVDDKLDTELKNVSVLDQELGGIEQHNLRYANVEKELTKIGKDLELANEQIESQGKTYDGIIADLEQRLVKAKADRLSAVEKAIETADFIAKREEEAKQWLANLDNQPKNAAAIRVQIEEAKTYNQAVVTNNENRKAQIVLKGLNDKAFEADTKVKAIDQERTAKLKEMGLPEGIALTEDGITVDGLPLDKNQVSTSKFYCTALRLAAMNIGEVKTLHFDASPLDKNTLLEIEQWAQTNDLQLLIERPDFDAGDIRYEIVAECEPKQ